MTAQTVELVRTDSVVVEKKYGLSYEEFAEKHLFANYPVVLGDACRNWPARTKFTPDFFRTTYGDREVMVEGQRFTLGAYIELMLSATADNPAPYPCKLQIDRDYPELRPDVSPRFRYALPDRTHSKLLPAGFLGGADTLEIFFGSPGGQFPYLHYDYMCLHAYITQLYGYKEFIVMPPDQTAYVYPKPEDPWMSAIDDIWNPDLERFPLLAQATPVSFVVGPGETLFIPCGWWHSARSLTPTISVALDCLNRSNWPQFRREVALLMRRQATAKAKAAQAYLATLGLLLNTLEKAGLSL